MMQHLFFIKLDKIDFSLDRLMSLLRHLFSLLLILGLAGLWVMLSATPVV